MSDRRKTVPALIVVMIAFYAVALVIGETDPLLAFGLMIPLLAGASILVGHVFMPDLWQRRPHS